MSESPASHPEDAPLISDDFLQGDVRAGLDRMRKRLLDLTARNRLLNFPQRPSKTSLRTVDELPDQLFGHLTNGRDLSFKAVPRPRGHRIPTDDGIRNRGGLKRRRRPQQSIAHAFHGGHHPVDQRLSGKGWTHRVIVTVRFGESRR